MANNRSKLIREPKTDNTHRSRLISAVDMAFDLKAPTMPEGAQYIFNAILQTPTVVLKNDTVDMEFEIPFDDDMVANEATFTVYNLSDDTLGRISCGNSICMTAGYGKDMGIIFEGIIQKVSNQKDGVDRVTTIYAVDDVTYTPQMMDETTYSEGTNASTILKDLLSRTGLEIAVFKPLRDWTFEDETKVEGSIVDNIKTYSDICGVATYIHKQKIYCRNLAEGDNIRFNVNSDTGMIDSPEQFDEERQSGDYVDRVIGYTVNMILQHRIGTASIITLDSKRISGEFRVESGTHSYDGLSATTEFKCIDCVYTSIKESTSDSSSSVSGSDGSGGSGGSVVSKAVAWALKIAKDDSHGYSQSVRWGPHYDCSSFVISAYEKAGVPVKTKGGANSTHDMYGAFKSCGFTDVTSSINLSTGSGLKKGDVLLNVQNHTALVRANGGAIVHASNPTKGILTRGYYNYPWNYVLRYKG